MSVAGQILDNNGLNALNNEEIIVVYTDNGGDAYTETLKEQYDGFTDPDPEFNRLPNTATNSDVLDEMWKSVDCGDYQNITLLTIQNGKIVELTVL